MKKSLILFLAVFVLLGTLIPAGAVPYISTSQRVFFTANGASFWAMIWDYTPGHGWRESYTPGYVNYDYWLGYNQPNYGEVHVAYLYSVYYGRYIEAQALRNVRFY